MSRHGITRIFGLLLVVALCVIVRSLAEHKRDEAIVRAVLDHDLVQVQLLKAKGAIINQDLAFLTALLEVNPARVKKMVDSGADINARDSEGNTRLIYAVNGSTIEIIRILIEHGAQVNAKGEDGTTALIDAVQCNDPQIVQLLLESGAKVNIQNDYQNTAWDFVEPGFGAKEAASISKLLKNAGARSYVWSKK